MIRGYSIFGKGVSRISKACYRHPPPTSSSPANKSFTFFFFESIVGTYLIVVDEYRQKNTTDQNKCEVTAAIE